ncbi:MAG TPA: heme-binding protein [Vicinamibacterales bacterium]|jgi:uncharacterized protein GlcG (DUF336 family)
MRRLFIVIPLLCAAACGQSPAKGPGAPKSAEDQVRAAQDASARASCRDLPSRADLQEYLRRAPAEGGEAGGMFGGKLDWAAIVNRNGEICAVAAATEDPGAAWPAGQALAKAKAFTANAFSTDTQPLSTARLYTLALPGHSMWGSSGTNNFRDDCIESPLDASKTDGRICGGSITVGGGIPLYKGKRRIGGLGISGDTPCADHEIAKRIRHIAQLDPERGARSDDISYTVVEGASIFTHPLCPNTWLNGKKIGDEPRAAGF